MKVCFKRKKSGKEGRNLIFGDKMSSYDLIIAGGGLAGCAAAYTAAKGGLKTLLIERGKYPGAKNVSGGRVYAHSLEKLIPGFAEEAPVERCVTTERVSLLTEKETVTMEYASQLNPDFAKRSYTVLRAKFDRWLWSKAAEKGARLLASTRVKNLVETDGVFTGVETDDEKISAPITIIADGVNSIITRRAGLSQQPKPEQVAIGVKEVIEFDEQIMRDRFGCVGDQGMAWLFAGAPTDGEMGGAFLYTNKTSISLGLVMGLRGAESHKMGVPALLARFKRHPAVAPLLEGGKISRYPAHMIPEGGLGMTPRLLGNGVMVAGDAAAMCVNLGYTVRGMDFAIAAGQLAAETAIEAHAAKNFGFEKLSEYKSKLGQSFVLKEMQLYSGVPEALDNKRVFSVWPQLACGLMSDLFTIDGQPRSLSSKFWSRARETGAVNLMRDGLNLLGAL